MKKVLVLLMLVLATAKMFAQVSVTATVGTLGPTTYTTLNSAFTAINAGTHKGVITISITGNTTEPATPVPLLKSATASSYSSITIKPTGGNWTINSAATPLTNRGIIELNGADNVTIDGDDPATAGSRNLSFVMALNATTGTTCIRLGSMSTTGADGADNNTIKNCIITGGRNSASSTAATYGIVIGGATATAVTTTGHSNLNCVIDNNLITRAYRGIYGVGTSLYPFNGMIIRNNVIGSATSASNIGLSGIYLTYTAETAGVNSVLIQGNDIRCGDYSTTGYSASISGIELGTTNHGAKIRQNNIHDVYQQSTAGYGAYGINCSGISNSVAIENNFIRDIVASKYTTTATSQFTNYGIRISAACTGMTINHNTIAFLAQNSTGSIANYANHCIATSASGVTISEFRNNILINNNTGTGSTCFYVNTTTNISGGTVNNNNYHVPNSGIVGYYNAASQSTLTAWQTATGKDASSTYGNPGFVSATDIHINTSSANFTLVSNNGAPIATITTDFDGDARSATTPDIGADEFTPPPCSSAVGGTVSPSSATKCSNQTQTFTATGMTAAGGINYQWEVSSTGGGVGFASVSGGSGATSTTYTTPLLSPGTYYYRLKVTCTNGSIDAYSNEVTYTINGNPTPSVNPAFTAMCSDNISVVALEATGGSTYSWSPATGLSLTNVANPESTPTSSITYTVVATDAIGCTGTATAVIVIGKPLLASASASPASVCLNGSTTLTANVGTTSSATYCSSGATNTTSTDNIANVTFAGINNNSANYPAGGATNNASAGNLYSNYTSTVSPAQVTAGSTYPFSVTQYQTAGYYSTFVTVHIDWNQNGVFTEANEKYAIGATAAAGTAITANIAVPASALNGTTRMRVVMIEGGSASNIYCGTFGYGETEDYSITVSGGAFNGTISWTPSVNLTSPTSLSTSASNISSLTTYTLLASQDGCEGSALVTVDLAAPVSCSPITSSAGNIFCGSANTVLTASQTAGVAPYTYTWAPSNDLSSANSASTTCTVSTTTVYTVTVSDACGSTCTSTFEIVINNAPLAPSVSTSSVTIDPGQSTTITASGTETTFNWYTTATGGTSIYTGATFTTPALCASATYYVEQNNGVCPGPRTAVVVTVPTISLTSTPSNALICASGDSVKLSVTSISGASYLWSSSETVNEIMVSPSTTTVYSVTVTASTCTYTFTQNVGVISGANLSPSVASSSFCYPAQTSNMLNSNLSAGNFGVATITYSPSTQPATGVTTLASGGLASTTLSGGTMDDGGWGGIPIGFSYNFFGSNFTTLGVGTNGLVMFGTIPGYSTTAGQLGQFNFASPAFPNTGNPGNVIGLMLSDMHFGQANTSLRYWTEGIAPTRTFVLSGTYAQYTASATGGALTTVQLKLFETTGIVEVHIASSAATTARTVGLQDATKTIGAIAPGWNGRTTTLTTPQAFRFSPPANYTYLWSTNNSNVSPTTATTSSINATVTATGNYSYNLSVTNPNTGCVLSEVLSFTANEMPVPSVASVNNVTCNGGNNGSATVSVVGGTAPYTYAWLPLGGTSETATNLAAGTYTITVTDALLCSSTTIVTITQPTVITPTVVSTSAVSCFGGSNGAAEIAATGGTGNYTYSWSPAGGTSNIASGLSAGVYTVTVTDDSLCAQTITLTITQPTSIEASVNTISQVSCFGGSDGAVSMNVTGGTSPYTYSWSPSGGTTSSATGLVEGNYTFTVTDANNCIANTVVSITQPTLLTVTINTTDPLCVGSNGGSASAIVNGGTPSYTYSWSAGGNTSSISNLSAGVYSVVVTDSKLCSVVTVFGIQDPMPMTINVDNSTNVTCHGGNNGAATISVSGGAGTLTYNWLPTGGNAASASGLTAGIYTVVVTDANSCTGTVSVLIFEPSPFTASISNSTPVSCFGLSNASAEVSTNGGQSPYTYSWSPAGGNASLATGLSAGEYTVTVTDASLCTASTIVSFNDPMPLGVDVYQISHVTCFGGNNGSIDFMAYGGSYPYTYAWSPSVSSTTAATGLSAGLYQVTVTDNNGCSASVTATINQPNLLDASISSSTNVLCFGDANGSATVDVMGGTTPYNYAWSPAGGSSSTASNLSAGTYTVTITDANNCSTSTNVTINDATLLMLTALTTNPTCYGGDGILSFSANGGTGNISYTVNSNLAISPMQAPDGSYTIVATDANGCSAQSQVLIIQPDLLTLTVNPINPTCNGGSGEMYFATTGGTGTITFVVNNNLATNPMSASAGIYSVVASDANGCSAQELVNITEPSAITISTSFDAALCNGGSGSISFSASGGTGLLSYYVNGTPQSSPMSGLAGTYTVSVVDDNSCTSSATVTITEPDLLTLSTTVTDALCNASLGNIVFAASGGTSPIGLYVDGFISNSPYAAGVGTYMIQAIDANGCSVSTSVTINEPTPVQISASSTNALCNGSNGSLSFSATGGTGSISYTVNGTSASSPALYTAGTYTVVATDANGCSAQTILTITEPSAVTLSAGSTDALCNGGNGSINFTAGGGTGSITYTVNGSSTNNNMPASAGTYTVVATDANGCSAQTSVVVSQPTAVVLTASSNNALCNGSNGSLSFSAIGGTGSISYTVNGTSASSPALYTAGTYTVVATDANGCSAQTILTITEPSAVTLSAGSTDALCNGGNGSINFTAGGGTGSITYTVNGSSANNNMPASAGTYTVVATDANGCSAQTSVVVSQPTAVVLTASSNNALCNGSNGSLSFSATGGTGSISYTVNGTSASSPALYTAGTYTVVATDANGCSAQTILTITEPSAVTLSAGSTDALCNGGNGSINFTAGGGTGSITYTVNGSSANNNMPASAGTYTVVATDANGCSAQTSVVVSQPTAVVLTASSNNALCNGSNGSLSFSATGGTGSISYTVNGTSASSPASRSAGTYTIVATDANGCSAQTILTITEPSAVTLSAGSTDALCNGSNGSLSFSATGGTGSITYTVNGSSASNNMPASAGTYTVVATDANGCSAQTSVVVSQPTAVVLTASSNNALCNGSNGSLSFSATGGTGSISYTVNGTSASSPASRSAGTYTIVATDANGCSAQTIRTITQPSVVSLTASATNALCNGTMGSISFNATGGTGAISTTVNGNPTISPASVGAGTYVIVATDVNNCTAQTSLSVSVPSAISLTTNSTNVVCAGGNGTLTFGASGGTGNKVFTVNGIVRNSPFATGAGTYTIVATDANGCTASSVRTITTINALPTVSLGADVTICQGGSTTLSLTFTGNSPWVYAINGGSPQLTASSTVSISVSPVLSTQYIISALSDATCSNSITDSVWVNTQPCGNLMPLISSALTYTVTYKVSSQPYATTATNSPTSFTATGLPVGLTMAGATGVISGIVNDLPGVYPVVISAINQYGSDTKTLMITVNPRQLTISGLTINTKVYDATTSATIIGTPNLLGRASGDVVNASGSPIATFNNSQVGNTKPVSVSGYTLSGTHAAYYTVTQPSLTGNITGRPATVSGLSAATKVYDGNTNATINGTPVAVGLVAGDSVSLNTAGAAANFVTAAYGYNKQVIFSGYSLVGSSASNYIFSQPASVVADIICASPTILSIVPTGNKVTVTWVGGALSYTLEYRVAGTLAWTAINTTASSYTITGLTTSTLYDVRLKLSCVSGIMSNYANGSFTTTSGCSIPSLTTPVVYGNSAKINWTGSADSIYQVNYRQLGSLSWGSNINLTQNTRTLTGLTVSTVYEYRVRSVCKNGDISVWVNGQFTTTSGCGVPTLNTPLPYGNSVKVSWNGSTDSIYQVSVKPTSSLVWGGPINSTTLNRTVTGLTVNTAYNYQVRSICKNGDISVWVSGQFTTTAGCGIPSLNAPTAVGGNSVTVNWNGSSDSIYQITYKPSSIATWPSASNTNLLSRKLTGLTINTTYDYQVRSICKSGDASVWVSGQFTTNAGCGLPILNAPTAINGNSATVNWTSLSDSVHQISYKPATSATWSLPGLATGTSKQLTGLTVNTVYNYRLRSVCKNGDISDWVVGSFTTNAGCPIVTLNTPVPSSTSAVISWTNVGAISYSADFYSPTYAAWFTLGNNSTTTRTIYGLLPNTTYQYRVRSSCSNADMSAYVTGTFTTSLAKENNTAMATLLNVNGTLNEEGMADLSWSSLSEWQVSAYEIEHRVGDNPFMPIATIPSKAVDGKSYDMLDYQTLHTSPAYGLNQYRIWILGIDGSRTLHNEVIGLRKSPFETIVNIYPNPASSEIHLTVKTDKTHPVDIKFLDATGRTIKAMSVSVQTGNNDIPVDINALPVAMYTMAVYREGVLVYTGRFQKMP